VLKYLAGKTLPSHAAILCGLVKNQVPTTKLQRLN
jgi:methionine S-methyltransferase